MAERIRAVLESTLTCPGCGHPRRETMPLHHCVFFYTCSGCGQTLRPLKGACCVFCSYGDTPCPPRQLGR